MQSNIEAFDVVLFLDSQSVSPFAIGSQLEALLSELNHFAAQDTDQCAMSSMSNFARHSSQERGGQKSVR